MCVIATQEIFLGKEDPEMTFGELPFGCRDCKITPYVSGVLGALDDAVDVPRIRTVELNVTRDSTDLEGDDVKVATHTFAKGLEGSIEAGGINLSVLSVLEGGDVVATGTTPNRTIDYKVEGDQAEGYFKIEAQMYGDDGGDMKFVAWKVKATNGPNFSFTQGEFALTACDLSGIFDESTDPSRLYTITQAETIAPIDITP
jgi:hypothetical protein